ncbi:hypothetical protein D8674_005358 [Pyrus ussuriensis x Pyrus communis]|uniref:Uncharacterized protein n=1 Tax=Pyrus ussuriensis x Pyrus communis TaxID=2448454 RepID=A0A5N5FVM9_9ROSA|nr:hypothetical protein D8674_005358 [Pyrus ussuriensis x Pyrus communis]
MLESKSYLPPPSAIPRSQESPTPQHQSPSWHSTPHHNLSSLYQKEVSSIFSDDSVALHQQLSSPSLPHLLPLFASPFHDIHPGYGSKA